MTISEQEQNTTSFDDTSVRTRRRFRSNISAITIGATVLAFVGTMVPAETPINRHNGERINTVQAFVARNVLPEAALRLVQQRIGQSGLVLPPGYRLEIGGDSDARDEVLRNLLASMGLIVSLTIAAIVLTFGSYRLAAVTAVVAMLSMGLSLLALAASQYPFGIQAVIGVIGSIGVSINAAIIIMTALQGDARALQGDLSRIAKIVMPRGVTSFQPRSRPLAASCL